MPRVPLVWFLCASACGSHVDSPPIRCATASAPVGAHGDYRLVARVRTDAGVRSVPQFPGLADHSNLLGVAPAGTAFAAQGPLKNPDHGNALAYAVLVNDATGATCRGYISAGLVDVEALPDAVRITDASQVPAAVGRRITLAGPVRTCRNPTVLGVDVIAAPSDCGKSVEVTGELKSLVVPPSPPTDEAIGARGPGTYYMLVLPDGALARVQG